MAGPSRPQLVLNESSLNFVLQLPSRRRERLLHSLRGLADTLHVEPMGIEQDPIGRDLYVRVVDGWGDLLDGLGERIAYRPDHGGLMIPGTRGAWSLALGLSSRSCKG